MQNALLPLFPLQLVLLPNTALPLHIFEERYKEMIGEVLRTGSEFGVVQAGEKGIVNTGCTAILERVIEKYTDGRMDILTIGRRRFEILTLDDEKSYLRGRVEFFDDEDLEPAPLEAREKAIAGFMLVKQAAELQILGEPSVDDPNLSFQLGQIVSDLSFRQVLLSTRSERERIQQLTSFLPQYAVKKKHIAHVKSVAPRNGHSKQTTADLL